MNDAEMFRLLSANCSWWREPKGWEQDDPDLRRLRESRLSYDPNPLEDIVPEGLYVLRGPRRVGKTLEAKKAISRLIAHGVRSRRIIHFACDALKAKDLRQLQRVGRDQATAGIEDTRCWFLDEITSVDGWAEEIKWLRDNTAFGRDCVVLTGSSSRDLDEARKALADRRGPAMPSDRLLLPMPFRAFCQQFRDPGTLPSVPVVRAADFLGSGGRNAVAEMVPWLDELGSLWEVYCRCGGLPPAVSGQLKDGDVPARFAQDLFDIAHGDALSRSTLNATQAMVLLGKMSRSLSSFANVSDVARDLGVDRKTADARIDDLISGYMAWPCHQRGDRAFPNLAKQNKIYFTDPLIARLAHLRDNRLPDPDISAISEQQIGQHLLRQAVGRDPVAYNDFSTIMCSRTSSGKELDFVGPGTGNLGFEGKYTDKKLDQEAATLATVAGKGVLASRGLLGEASRSSEILFVPAAFVAYLLA